MVEIRINNTGDGTWWLYNKDEIWKEYVCDNFDDKIVITGNRDYSETTEAEWWHRAKEIIDDLDYNGTMDIDIDDYEEWDYPLEEYEHIAEMVNYYKYTRESIEAVIKAYDECEYSDDIDFIVKVARIITGKNLVRRQIYGYTQREWQYIVYDQNEFDNDPTEIVEAYYFGKIADVTIDTGEEEYGDIITHDELWEIENKKNLKEELRKRYEIPEDEEIVIFQCDGYKQVPDWKKIG